MTYSEGMEAHRNLIARFGGTREMARKLDHSNPTTVQGWWDRARIPMERWAEIAAAAKWEDIAFDMSELMPAASLISASDPFSPRTLTPQGIGYRRQAAGELRQQVDDFAECLAEGGSVAQCAAQLGRSRAWGKSALVKIVAGLGCQAR